MGIPKALVQDRRTGEFWVHRAVRALRTGGCDELTVVLGAGAERATRLLQEETDPPRIVVAEDWAEGMGRSLAAGLQSLATTSAGAAVVMLVDLPDVGSEVVHHVLDSVHLGPDCLARASYEGRPGHPVVLGRHHWSGVLASARGDSGARDYLHKAGAHLIECGQLATGADCDTPTGWADTGAL